MSDNPYADLIPKGAKTAPSDNPYADLIPKGAAPSIAPAPAAAAPPPNLGATRGRSFDPIIKGIANPIANFLDYPVRAIGSDIYGAIKGGLPTDEASREKFYEQRGKALESTALPENEFGSGLSTALGLPGQGMAAAVRGLSNVAFGPEATEQLGPAATVAGDALPFALGGAARARSGMPTPAAMQPSPPAAAARSAGYRLPPEEIGNQPSFTSRMLSGLSGKWKKQQEFSEANQANTNRLAAQSIGLPPGTRMTEAAIKTARAPADAAYGLIKQRNPETVLGADPEYRRAVDQIGMRSAELERFFPEAAHTPEIVALREQMRQNDVVPTDVAMKKIADLRKESTSNFRKQGDAQAHALGYAQRQAANAMEGAIERSIGHGPDRIAAFAQVASAERQLAAARADSQARAGGAGTQAIADAEQAVADAQQKLQQLGAPTPADIANAQVMLDVYRNARRQYAKTYDVELATNKGTGDVIARRIASLRQVRNRPLTGELQQIADMADAFPKEVQFPGSFGHVEDFSVLDLVGGGSAIAAGHPIAGGIIGARYPARKALVSPGYQNRMFNRRPALTDPGSAARTGTIAQPHDRPDADDPLARALAQ